jgi:DNA-binding transcriptional regulator LsrR (DeoR family)
MKFDIMDHSGHSTEAFDKADPASLAAAQARFNELISEGRTAAVRTGDATSRIVRKFDPTAEGVLFIPRLQGG